MKKIHILLAFFTAILILGIFSITSIVNGKKQQISISLKEKKTVENEMTTLTFLVKNETEEIVKTDKFLLYLETEAGQRYFPIYIGEFLDKNETKEVTVTIPYLYLNQDRISYSLE